ncbi:MAG: methylenetetrahydrofolate reductase [Propionibacteriaceae bacterium]|jgi:methylenetetrahydrofolate reductase (NADPH)|nr:methylenetetrahydrofolate reductase [Propionibacteriaceae bacterium]
MSTTIADLLARGDHVFGFEFFPPKDEAGEAALAAAIDQLVPLAPQFVSVTYGASGSNKARTLAVTRQIAQRAPLTVMGHLTVTGQTRDELIAAIDAYADAGISHILGVRGDMPGGPSQPWEQVPGGLANATELVELIASRGPFCIGVAAFPDVHPNGSPELDVRILRDKQDAGASFAITQLFFDPTRYLALVERARASGCTLPVIPGIMPITRIGQLKRFAELSGAALPTSVTSRLNALADDPIAVRDEGAQIGLELSQTLLASGAPGLQFFTQNRSGVTREILATVKSSPAI